MVFDPLTALGLASNVVQFVDFSWKLVSSSRAIYQSADGALLENRELEMIADDLSRLTCHLHSSLEATGKSSLLTASEKELRDLSQACEAVAKELLAAVDRLKVKGKRQKWGSFLAALRTVWSKEKVDTIKQRLREFRSQLDTRVLLSLRSSIDLLTLRQSEIFDSFDNGTQIIIDRLLDNRESISVEFHDACIKLGKAQAHTNTVIADEHRKTRAEIINAIRDAKGLSRTLSFSVNAGAYIPIEDRILESLRFKTMPDRHDEIPISHKKTFEWIYRDSTEETKSWSNFAEWLRRDDGIFWIAGKAGSGKSTLMKYLYDNPKTREELLSWSKETPLITAAFFFWKTGTSMQKSQIGLLQSLLHETLSQCHQLIPIVLPERWQEYQLNDHGSALYYICEWTHAELSRAFRRLVTQDILPAKFCFLIDGLDEYDGDPAAIVTLFKDIPPSSSIKICISSRPLVVCEEAFDQGPMLMLQDLTYNDIEIFVNDTLGEHSRMQQLKKEDPDNAPELVTDIVDRASGVFLWVKLVVRSLLDGLSNYDGISDLQARLRLLPNDLEDLYWHMLKDVEPLYRIQAWKLFQIVRRARSPLSPLLLSYADDDPQSTLLASKKTLEVAEIEARCKAIERRLKSRCKGLLEIQYSSRNQIYTEPTCRPFRTAKVLFLHRSVDDFLEQPEVQNMLIGHDEDCFDANHSLMRAHLVRLKWRDPQDGIDRATLAELVSDFLEYAAAAEIKTGEGTIPFVEEFDRVANECWLQGQLITAGSALVEKPNADNSWVGLFWTTEALNECGDSFFTLAIQYGLALYVKRALAQDSNILNMKKGQPLLEYAIAPQWKKVMRPISVEVIKTLLEAGADPNKPYRGSTPWQKILDHVYTFLPTTTATTNEKEIVDRWYETFKLFLEYGADPDALITPGQKFKSDERLSLTATDVVAASFSKVVILKGVELNALLLKKSREKNEKASRWFYLPRLWWT